MLDPLKALEAKVAEIEDAVQRAVEIRMLREVTKFNLSRLATLDADKTQKYLDLIAGMD